MTKKQKKQAGAELCQSQVKQEAIVEVLGKVRKFELISDIPS